MPVTASVNYHINSSEPQAYYIDAGGIQGELVSPELVTTEVQVNDVRNHEVRVDFKQDSVAFVNHDTEVKNFSDESWRDKYDQELTVLLAEQVGAEEVIVFDHTVRIDDPDALRRPARNVHSDYSIDGAQQRLKDLLGNERATEWSNGHFGFVNVWRPIENVIETSPLGFVHPNSVSPDGQLTIELIYPDRKGQIMGLVANTKHKWLYQSHMTPDEVAIFNIYDNQGLKSIYHSALDLSEDPISTVPRKSIESRTLVRYR